jgi:hypothetical protein
MPQKNRLPGSHDAADTLADIDMANLEIVLAYGSVTMTIKANEKNPDWTFWMARSWWHHLY